MLRLMFVAAFFTWPAVALHGVDETRARLILQTMDRAFSRAGLLNPKDRMAALGYDASQYSRVLALEKHPSIYHLLSVRNTAFLISFLTDLLFELVKLTATEIVNDVKGRVA